jgi:hypothetical protein
MQIERVGLVGRWECVGRPSTKRIFKCNWARLENFEWEYEPKRNQGSAMGSTRKFVFYNETSSSNNMMDEEEF